MSEIKNAEDTFKASQLISRGSKCNLRHRRSGVGSFFEQSSSFCDIATLTDFLKLSYITCGYMELGNRENFLEYFAVTLTFFLIGAELSLNSLISANSGNLINH